MKALSALFCIVSLLLLASCSTIPKANLTYYQTKTNVNVKVIHSVACDKDLNPIIASSAITTVSHSADTNSAYEIKLSDISRIYSDDEFKFELTEDGRLKSLNSTSNGQGDNIVKAATALLPLIVAFDTNTKPFEQECKFIKTVAGDKPLTITFSDLVDFAASETQKLKVFIPDTYYYNNLKKIIPDTCVDLGELIHPKIPVTYEESLDYPKIEARQPAIVPISVGFTKSGFCSNSLFAGSVPVAHLGTRYQIPISKPTFFGKQTINATFSDSGALSSLMYSDISGTTSATNSANSLITMLQGQTISQEVAALKNESELIAQQQRLITCKANPKDCK